MPGITPYLARRLGTASIVGLVVDGLTFVLPTIASAMWRAQYYATAVGAWTVWLGFTVLTVIATAGFTPQRIGDAIAARASVITEAYATADQRTQAIEI